MSKFQVGEEVICVGKMSKKIYGIGWKKGEKFVISSIINNDWDNRGAIYWKKGSMAGVYEIGLKLCRGLTQYQRLKTKMAGDRVLRSNIGIHPIKNDE